MGQAAEQARGEGKYLLLNFSGSDWCGWCIRLDDEVFGKKAFKSYADKKLVGVMIDTPRRRALPKRERDQSDRLKKEYAIRGFPTVIMLHPDGHVLGRTGYRDGGPDRYVAHLQEMIDAFEAAHPDRVPRPQASPPEPRRPEALPTAGTEQIASDENRPLRTWTSKSGAERTASLIETAWGYAVLRKPDGGKMSIAISRLSEADQEYVRGLRQSADHPPVQPPP
jgi:thiol-disulfide isomerase/thioredoxin